jgi:uncharacterized RDD family membrane protein YckC
MGAQWKQKGRVAAADAKGRVFTKLAKEIMIAARNGADVSMNPRLRLAVEAAKKASMTKDTLERAIKKGAGLLEENVNYENVIYEGFAPHQVPVIVECLTENKNRTATNVRVLFRKGQLATSGAVSWDFAHVGIVEASNPAAPDAEAAAIEAGTVVDRIAPPRLRLQAGVLDALPLILVSFFIVAKMQESGGTIDDLYDRANYLDQIWMWIAAYAVYFLHTLISELVTGRTLGKWIFGLRVTKLDGTRPTAMQFLIRNFIRVLEFHLLLPLIVIVFSPLNQRIGDMAAGTVVLADDVPVREEEDDVP